MSRAAQMVAFASGLGIAIVGMAGVVQPAVLLWTARQFVDTRREVA